MGAVEALRCRECGLKHPPTKISACGRCFAPLDVVYDFNEVNLSRESLGEMPNTIWRYFDLLPLDQESSIVDLKVGCTPLIRCSNLGKHYGLENLYVKNDAVNPTYSFKDRPASVAVSKAIEFGDKAVGCASTGNLAAAVAAHAAKAGLPCYVLAPSDIEPTKIAQIMAYDARIIAVRGTYDDANRLAILASEAYGWNIANITSRPYYVEGSKTMAFEICEQLGWKVPDHAIIPVASGALLCAMWRGFQQFEQLGLIGSADVKLVGAQAAGCGPIADAFKRGSCEVIPIEHPNTIAKSIAIGDPGDGRYVLKAVRETGGSVDHATDLEIIEAIKLLAKTEGIFTEPAGAVTIAVLKHLVDMGEICRDDEVVCCVTGNGLKTSENIFSNAPKPVEIDPTLEALDRVAGSL